MLRRFALVVATLAALFAAGAPQLGCSEAPARAEARKECYVHITRTGNRYHMDHCRYLRYSDYVVSLSEARDRGLTACKVCGGSDCD